MALNQISLISDPLWALAAMAQWIEHWTTKHRVTGLTPGQGTCLGCGLGPIGGGRERQPHTGVSFSFSLSLPLSKNKYSLEKNKSKKVVRERRKK